MKVLFVQKIAGISGSEKYILEIMPALKKRGIDCEFLGISDKKSDSKNDKILQILKENNIPFHYLLFENNFSFSLLSQINDIIKTNRFDIVQSNLIHADFWLAQVKLLFKTKFKLVSGKHGYDEPYNAKYGFTSRKIPWNPYYFLARYAELFTDRSFAIGTQLKDFYCGIKICNSLKTDVIHYGYDFPEVKILDQELSTYKFSSNQLVIVGRLTAFKGHSFAFEALQTVVKKIPDVKLLIVGSGALDAELKQLAKDLQIENQVVFVGHSIVAVKYMASSDVVLVPSVSEGFGIINLEAFSVKKPVIAFDVPTCNEIIESGKTGVLVPFCDINELSNAIIQLLSDKKLTTQLGLNANEKLKQYFTMDRMVNETIQFYNKVLSDK